MFRKLLSVLVTSTLLLCLLPEVLAANPELKREAQRVLREAGSLLKNDQYQQALEEVRRAEQLLEQLSGETVQPAPDAPVEQEPDPVPQDEEPPTVQQPPAAQVAPSDARFNSPLNITLDSTASVLDFVSYPGGDQQDMVRYEILRMNSNSSLSGGRARLVIASSCFGQGTDQIRFFTGGQEYSCGDTLVDKEVTYNSRTGSVTVTAIGGEGTYVQWVLTGTATRVN